MSVYAARGPTDNLAGYNEVCFVVAFLSFASKAEKNIRHADDNKCFGRFVFIRLSNVGMCSSACWHYQTFLPQISHCY